MAEEREPERGGKPSRATVSDRAPKTISKRKVASRRKPDPAPTTPDPIEIAMEAEAGDTAADSPARMLLVEQRQLIEGQVQLNRLERFGRRLANVRDLAVMLGVLALLAGAGAVIWNAATSRGLVVESFQTPPALAAQGLSGTAAAQAVSDRITAIQNVTRSTADRRKITNAWSQEIRIEASGAGLSLGEIERLLRERLGHNTKLGGTLIQEADGGLALTVRGDGIPARTFRAAAGDYPQLAGQAADYLFSAADPQRMILYLYTNGRATEALTLWTRTMAHATPDEQRQLLLRGGDVRFVLGRYDEAAALYRDAIARGDGRRVAEDNLVWVLAYAGREEEAAAVARSYLPWPRSASRAERVERDINRPAQFLVIQNWGAFHAAWAANDARNRAQGGFGGSLAAPMMAYGSARQHHWSRVRTDLMSSDPDHPSTVAMVSLIDGMRALDEDRPADAVGPLTAYAKMWRENELVRFDLHDAPCRLALALALTGRRAEAETVIGQTGRYVECYAARAQGFEAAGDRAGADRAFAAAIALAPSAAFAYEAYGRALLARGDLAAALAYFAPAETRAPHWADPLKGFGDVLARQGKWGLALARYDRALLLAPKWLQLRQARDEAAKRAPTAPKGKT